MVTAMSDFYLLFIFFMNNKMTDHTMKYVVIALALTILGFGIYLTVVSREDPAKNPKIPAWVTKHLKAIKIAGPAMIAVGVVALGFAGFQMSKGKNFHASSNFGFRFY